MNEENNNLNENVVSNESKSKFCIKCGSQMDINSKFCTKCGKNQDEPVNTNNVINNNVNQNKPKVSIGKCIAQSFGISCIIFLLPWLVNFILISMNVNVDENLKNTIDYLSVELSIGIILLGPVILYFIKSRK